MVRLAGEGLRSVGAPSPSKSACSILPLARRWRAGDVFSGSTPARASLLKPATDVLLGHHRTILRYSPECVEGRFCELRLEVVLRKFARLAFRKHAA